MALELKTVTSVAGVLTLKYPWRALAGSNRARIFQTFEFAASWLWSLGPACQPLILAVFEADRLIGLAPLKINPKTKTINFLTEPEGEHQDFLLAKAKETETLDLIFKELF